MKSKKVFNLVLLFAFITYSISFIATSKRQDLDPCQIAINDWFYKDSSVSNHSFFRELYADTLVINTDSLYTINWNSVTDSLCKIYANNCSNPNKPILIINYKDTVRSNWDTRFGKKIFFKRCP
jgi:hypothetical protein